MSTSRSPTLAQAVTAVIAERLRELHTSMPGEVQSYDAEKQTADVLPLVRVPVELEDGTVASEALPVITGVPVVFPGAGGFRFTLPVKKGDGVLLVFAEAHLDRWKTQGGLQNAPLRRRFALTDAIAIPGLVSQVDTWQGASSSDATLGADDGPQIVFKTAEIHLGATSSDPATEPVILGQSYTNHEGAALQSLVTALGQVVAQLAVAATSLGTAAAVNATPIVGGALAASPFAAVVTQLGLIGGQLGSIASALGQFRGQLAGDLSQKVKTK